MTISEKVPVYVISGFLGSGKTTVLVNMIARSKKKIRQPGINLNEIGATNVEGHLFENDKMVELLNGCICCTIQDDRRETMHKLIEEKDNGQLDIYL